MVGEKSGRMDQISNYRLDDIIAAHSAASPRIEPEARSLTEVEWLELARQQRAGQVRALFATPLPVLGNGRTVLTIIATMGASGLLMAVYADLLAREGLTASMAALCAVLLASTVSGVAGFAFSAVCGAMLLRIMTNPVQVVETMLVCSIAIQAFSVSLLWRDIDWRRLRPFIAGGVCGLPVGVWLLLNLRHAGFKEAVGVLLTGYAAYALFKRPTSIKQGSNLVDGLIGFIGGITGGLAAFPGAAVTIWCGMRGWDKRCQRGVYQPFILIMQVLALGLIQGIGKAGPQGVGFNLDPLQFVPAALLGTWFGMAIFKRLSDRYFTLFVNLLLLASGIGFIL